jgi:hypothetical protein
MSTAPHTLPDRKRIKDVTTTQRVPRVTEFIDQEQKKVERTRWKVYLLEVSKKYFKMTTNIKNKFGKISEMVEGFCFITFVTGL